MIDPKASLLSADEIAAFRKLLEQQSAESRDAIQAADTGTVMLDQTSVGRLSRMDAMQQQAMAKGLKERTQRNQIRLQAALDRMQAGAASRADDARTVDRRSRLTFLCRLPGRNRRGKKKRMNEFTDRKFGSILKNSQLRTFFQPIVNLEDGTIKVILVLEQAHIALQELNANLLSWTRNCSRFDSGSIFHNRYFPSRRKE